MYEYIRVQYLLWPIAKSYRNQIEKINVEIKCRKSKERILKNLTIDNKLRLLRKYETNFENLKSISKHFDKQKMYMTQFVENFCSIL